MTRVGGSTTIRSSGNNGASLENDFSVGSGKSADGRRGPRQVISTFMCSSDIVRICPEWTILVLIHSNIMYTINHW